MLSIDDIEDNSHLRRGKPGEQPRLRNLSLSI